MSLLCACGAAADKYTTRDGVSFCRACFARSDFCIGPSFARGSTCGAPTTSTCKHCEKPVCAKCAPKHAVKGKVFCSSGEEELVVSREEILAMSAKEVALLRADLNALVKDGGETVAIKSMRAAMKLRMEHITKEAAAIDYHCLKCRSGDGAAFHCAVCKHRFCFDCWDGDTKKCEDCCA